MRFRFFQWPANLQTLCLKFFAILSVHGILLKDMYTG